MWCVPLYRYKQFGSVWTTAHRSGTCLDTMGFFFYQGVPKSRWRPIPTAGEGRQRIEGSGYKKFGSGMPVQMRCKTRLVGMQNGGRTFVNAAANVRDVKRGRFDPVHHLLFRVVATTEEKSNTVGRFQGCAVGCCGLVKRLYWVATGVSM